VNCCGTYQPVWEGEWAFSHLGTGLNNPRRGGSSKAFTAGCREDSQRRSAVAITSICDRCHISPVSQGNRKGAGWDGCVELLWRRTSAAMELHRISPHPIKRRNQSIKESTLCSPPFRAARAKLGETKTTFLNTPEERCWPIVSQYSSCRF
jgi:hypothetical protein